MQGMTGTEKQEQTTMNEHETSAPIRAKSAQSGSTSVLLTKIRGKIRRTQEGVEKQRLELLAAQIDNGVPAAMVARQLGLMEGGR